jgi:hypothetical protein
VHYFGANEDLPDVYADELYRRMRFDVLKDREVLEGASYKYVRGCLRALVRRLELCDDEDDNPAGEPYSACLVLDGGKIEMLANLTFHEDGVQEGFTLETCKLWVVSIYWKRPETTRDLYRGVWDFAIDLLPRVYESLASKVLEAVEEYMGINGG